MQRKKEILVGIVLVLVLAVLLVFVHARSVQTNGEYHFYLSAQFDQADGIMTGNEVRIAGMPVGEVVSQSLTNSYQANVLIAFHEALEIPIDSSLTVETNGILGTKYLEIVPGSDEEFLENGDSFEYTQGALIVGDLLEKVNVYMKEKKENESIDSKASDAHNDIQETIE